MMASAVRMRMAAAGRVVPVGVTDSFNRANSTTTMGSTDTGQVWVPTGTWGISSNQAYNPGSVDGQVVLCEVSQSDVTVQANLMTGYGGIICRAADSSNYYLVNCKPAGQVSTIFKCVGGTFTGLGTFTTGISAGSLVAIQAIGTQIKAIVDGTTQLTITDASIVSGTQAGFRHNDVAGNLYDNFSASPAGWNPTSLAGKRLWLRAKDCGAGGSSVISWTDQARGQNATSVNTAPTVAAASTPAGGKSIRFVNTGFFSLGNMDLSSVRRVATVASTELDASLWAATQATDANYLDRGWASSTLPAWLRVQLSSATVITQYRITSRPSSTTQAPNAWTFEGSNDASSWTVLDTRSGQSGWGTTEQRVFSFANTTAYLYYRINISAVNGDTIASMAEFDVTALAAAGELWVVIKVDSGAWGEGWNFGFDTSGADLPWFPYSSGTVYENFGLLPGARTSFTPTLALSSWRTYRVTTDGTTWQAFLNGVSQKTLSGQKLAWNAASYLGGYGSNQGSTCNIAEVIIRDRVSTSTEAANIAAYFTAEHGV